MVDERTANLLGMVGLAVADRMRAAAGEAIARGGEAAAALAAIGHWPGLSVGDLATALGLSHAGTVRLIDGLVRDGLAARQPHAGDARMVAIYLTEEGQARRRALLEARRAPLAAMLEMLSTSDQARFARVLDALARKLCAAGGDASVMCRFCDPSVCRDCPMLQTD